ncbi:hypothetical protein FOXYSP1_19612 [Fusarium oxysporum f. sp. phaseoli]
MGGRNQARYWVVRENSDTNNTPDRASTTQQSAMEKIIATNQTRLKEEDATKLRNDDLEEDIDRDSSWAKRLGWMRHLVSVHEASEWVRAKAPTEGRARQAVYESVYAQLVSPY